MKSYDLLILSCSALKKRVSTELPALFVYDGPAYRVLRSYIRKYGWPSDLKVGILSAEHGLIGCMTPITYYDRRMTCERSEELRDSVITTLKERSKESESIIFVCGKDYMSVFDDYIHQLEVKNVKVIEGPIGRKLQYLSRYLHNIKSNNTWIENVPFNNSRPLYFLPDWEDVLDPANVCMIDIYVANEKFVDRDEGSCEIFIDVAKLQELIKGQRGDVRIEFIDDRINVYTEHAKYTMRVLGEPKEYPQLLSLEFTDEVKINSDQFTKMIESVSKISTDYVKISSNINEIRFESNNKMDYVEGVIRTFSKFKLGNSSSIYPMRYLREFAKLLDSGDIKMSFGNDYPLQVVGDINDVKFHYILQSV